MDVACCSRIAPRRKPHCNRMFTSTTAMLRVSSGIFTPHRPVRLTVQLIHQFRHANHTAHYRGGDHKRISSSLSAPHIKLVILDEHEPVAIGIPEKRHRRNRITHPHNRSFELYAALA